MNDWIWGLAGGLLIGSAGGLYLIINGRIMGASGIIGGLADRTGWPTAAERLSFLAGLIALPALIAALAGPPATHLSSNPAVIVAAGLLVGTGTRLANGCTSGHGVCGISRLSVRGIVATALFLAGGGLSVLLFRHILGVI